MHASGQMRQNTNAATISVTGARTGGDYAAEAAETEPDLINRLALLAAGAYMAQERLPVIRDQYERAPEPKDS